MSYIFRSSTKKVVISFDWHHDRDYRYLLKAWLKNAKFSLDFDDLTPGEIDTSEVGRVKAVLTTKIRSSTHMLVLVGEYANSFHPDREKIGARNWQWWEIEKAKSEGKSLIAVKINSKYESPDPIKDAGATWAMSFTEPAVLKAVESA